MKRFSVFFSAEDGEWIATCDAHPLLSWCASTPLEALSGLVRLIDDIEEGKA